MNSRARAGQLLAIVVAVIAMLAFLALGEEVREGDTFRWDSTLVSSLSVNGRTVLSGGMTLVTLTGGGTGLLLLGAVGGAVLLARRRVEDAFFLAFAIVGSDIAGGFLKGVFDRARPVPARDAARLLPSMLTTELSVLVIAIALLLWPTRWRRTALMTAALFGIGVALDRAWAGLSSATAGFDSFPSGHAVSSMAFAAALAILAWPTRWRWYAFFGSGLGVVAVGVSRVSLGFHFPTDVLAGWCVGLAWVATLSLIFELVRRRGEPSRQLAG